MSGVPPCDRSFPTSRHERVNGRSWPFSDPHPKGASRPEAEALDCRKRPLEIDEADADASAERPTTRTSYVSRDVQAVPVITLPTSCTTPGSFTFTLNTSSRSNLSGTGKPTVKA